MMERSMRFFVLALGLAATCAPHITSLEAKLDTAAASPYALAFLPPAKCDEAPDMRQCLVASPKEWSDGERRAIEESLQRLTTSELVRGILVKAVENGYVGIRRYSSDTKREPSGAHVTKFSPGFVLYTSKVVGITDAFFETADMKDHISGYRFGDFILLHELIHAFDDRKESTRPGFTSATGWVFRNNRWVYTNSVGISEYNGVFADTLTLYARGRYADAWMRDRSFATAMRFPLPTIQSLATPGESFADILAHLILDPTAATYLKRPVIDWFETQVFPTLRHDASRF
jgi:hypothetical protein